MSTETWFWVGSYSQKIKPVHIERFSANSVWVDGRRKARFTPSQWSPADGYYPTWQEAKNALIAAAEAKVMQARNALQRANDELGNIKGLKP